MPCAVKGDCDGVQERTPSMVVLFGGAGRYLCKRGHNRKGKRGTVFLHSSSFLHLRNLLVRVPRAAEIVRIEAQAARSADGVYPIRRRGESGGNEERKSHSAEWLFRSCKYLQCFQSHNLCNIIVLWLQKLLQQLILVLTLHLLK